MCKINGHSFFTYLAQPWNASKIRESKKVEKKAAAAQQQAQAIVTETQENHSEGEEISKTAKTVQVNKNKKNQTLSSLRVPLENSVGASLGDSPVLGLNLGG